MALRDADYLARNHTEQYLTVGQEYGLGVTGIMGEVKAAAIWRADWLLDS